MDRAVAGRWGIRLAAVALSLAVLAPVSLASSRWVTDANDTKGFLDIKAVAHGHGSGPRLKHTLTTFARWRSRDLWCGAITFDFPELNREVIVFYRRGLKALMLNDRTREGIGNPKVTRPTKRRVAVVFPRKWLRRGLDDYGWSARTVRHRATCPGRGGDPSDVFRDRSPRRGRLVSHRL